MSDIGSRSIQCRRNNYLLGGGKGQVTSIGPRSVTDPLLHVASIVYRQPARIYILHGYASIRHIHRWNTYVNLFIITFHTTKHPSLKSIFTQMFPHTHVINIKSHNQ